MAALDLLKNRFVLSTSCAWKNDDLGQCCVVYLMNKEQKLVKYKLHRLP